MMRRSLTAAALGAGMLAEAFIGSGCSADADRASEVPSTTVRPSTNTEVTATTLLNPQVVEERKAAAIAQVDIVIQCDEERPGDEQYSTANQKTFTDVAEVTRFGLAVGGDMVGFDVGFNPEADELRVRLVNYDFTISEQPVDMGAEPDAVVPISSLTEATLLEPLAPLPGEDGTSYELYLGVSRPDGADAAVSIFCLRTTE